MSGFATAELTSRESLETFIALTRHESSRGSCRSFGHCGIGFRLHQQRHWGPASVSCRDAMEGKKAENADEVGVETAQKMKNPAKNTGPARQSRLERAWRRTYIQHYAATRRNANIAVGHKAVWHAAILPGCSRQQHIAWILICDVGETIALIACTKSWYPLGLWAEETRACSITEDANLFLCCRQICAQLCGTLKSNPGSLKIVYCLSFLYLLLYAFFWQAER